MKVVIPVGALHVGGGCRVLAGLANTLHAAGHDVDVVIPEAAPLDYELSCNIVKVPQLSPETIPYGDIVLPNFYSTFAPAYAAWPTQCVRLSLGFEPLWVPDPEVALWTYATGVPVISISNWLAEQIANAVNVPSRVVNLGVNPLVFHPKGKKRHHHEKVILYIARDPDAGYALKGFSDFQEAMQKFSRRYKGKYCVYLICPERVLALDGIPHRTFQPKSDREIAHLYRRADVFVSTSWFEGFALPPLEALACGTPVVTTDSGGLRDFCLHKETAYMTRPKDTSRLAHGIYKVLRNREFRKHIMGHGLTRAKQLTEETQYLRMVQALEEIHFERLTAEPLR